MSDKDEKTKKVLSKKDEPKTNYNLVLDEEFLFIPFQGDMTRFSALCKYLLDTFYFDELMFVDNDNHTLTPVIFRIDKDKDIKAVPKIYVSRNGDFVEKDSNVERMNLAQLDDTGMYDGKTYYMGFFEQERYDYLNAFYIMGIRFKEETIATYRQQYKGDMSLKTQGQASEIATKVSIVFSNWINEGYVQDLNSRNSLYISCNYEKGTHLMEYYNYMHGENINKTQLFSPDLTLVIEGESANIKKFEVESNNQLVAPVFDDVLGLGSITLRPNQDTIIVKPKEGMDLTCRWMAPDGQGKMVDLISHQVHFARAFPLHNGN